MIRANLIGDVLHLVIDRVDKANALTQDMLCQLSMAIENSATEAKMLVLTAEGSVFSAGADLDDVANGDLAVSDAWEHLSQTIVDFPGLSVAALNGTVAGGANGMVLACDIRIAAPHAKFFYPVMKRGYLPQPSDPKRMTALIGPARTKMILMAGQKIDATEALAWGLIDRIATSPLDAALALGDDVLNARPDLIHGIKSLCS
ncbi:enoyl-CoA hydratase/isomerase family protein [Aestuariibius sp. HNIBRBA575]|uniref:enoyl-CoA hydratase/isomerase family protein n=1 Tax=Aestuariibius sp. HNIBRBA575 TaxID=3233343 RepID=UPI0034A388D8